MRISDWSSDVCSSDLRRWLESRAERVVMVGRSSATRTITIGPNIGMVTVTHQQCQNVADELLVMLEGNFSRLVRTDQLPPQHPPFQWANEEHGFNKVGALVNVPQVRLRLCKRKHKQNQMILG